MSGSRRPPPPSFDSFPAAEAPNAPSSSPASTRRASPPTRAPSFDSFPAPPVPTPADTFLSGLEQQLDQSKPIGDKPGHRRSKHHDGSDPSTSGSGGKQSTDKRDERHSSDRKRKHERGHHDRPAVIRDLSNPSSSSSSSSSSRKATAQADQSELGSSDQFQLTEHEYGHKRRKPYQLVQATVADENAKTAPKVSSSVSDDPDNPPYYSSRTGDELNIKYGSLNRSAVPRYRRLGGEQSYSLPAPIDRARLTGTSLVSAGRVVGLNEGLRITSDTAYTGRGVEIGPMRRFRTPRYSDSRSARHMLDKDLRRISLAAKSTPGGRPRRDPFAERENLVAFDKEHPFEELMQGLEHEEGTDYRSVAGQIKPSDLSTAAASQNTDAAVDENEFDQLGVTGGESESQYLSRRNIEFDRALRDDPKNVELWLEFVEWQDQVALSASGENRGRTILNRVERRGAAQVKLVVVERALKADPANAEDERLVLKLLQLAEEVEDTPTVTKRWKKALEEHAKMTSLWVRYVGWRQTDGTSFEVESVVEAFVECFETLQRMADLATEFQERDIFDANMVYLFLRLCLMLRQAGYIERALASFQAIVELNLFRPVEFQSGAGDENVHGWRSRTLAALDSFWDDESPRVGENGAVGWCNTAVGADAPDSQPDQRMSPSTDEDSSGLDRWARSERLASMANLRPARLTDESVDEDDVARVPLFDTDIKPLLFIVDSSDAKQQLIYAFLAFLGLPFVPPDVPTSTPFATDGFIHSRMVEQEDLVKSFWPSKPETTQAVEVIDGEAMEPERKPALEKPWHIPFNAMPCSVELLFAAQQGWFTAINERDLEGVDSELARNALALLSGLSSADDPFLHLDAFAFEACQSPNSAGKLAKSVLRRKRQTLVLWDGYARIERARGKVSDARQVYVTALSMYRTFPNHERIDGPLLWRSWAEMEWEEGGADLALKVLVAATAAGDGEDLATLAKTVSIKNTPAQNLRARQFYTTELEASFQPSAPQRLVRNRNHLAFSFALFDYLSHGDLTSFTTEIFERHLSRLENTGAKGSCEHEEAYQAYVKLLYRHAEKGKRGHRPAQLREVLERAIAEFRNNSMFLSVYYHNELRTKIQNRVRRTMEDLVLTKKPTSQGYLFAIFAESHLDFRSTNVWGVRNLFERAVEDPSTRSCPSIWALYIDFELRNEEFARVKTQLYRAIEACPWCRDLYLIAFRPDLKSVFSDQDLRQQWHEAMLRRGLRVRYALPPPPALAESDSDEHAEDEFFHIPLPYIDATKHRLKKEEGERTMDDVETIFREREALKPY
ncbi:BZ3500_MvSof-1268-A1-R1_Chr1-3g02255 [Microbotryum saponariae]|uniref:BZ3500_MvSof-1268-A1-R1_Chr1-3g02255 protein n=1 Tax=Microbotryum saponariae TaxID=289078 RepID=A0A2X0KBS8_9BASI|nr:BZ3500_MvSof-1268-A1-R1_Chr1-3g02255 [Microbotryum saponariae]SCZ95793.1 BZ3501_MvSof-1269-A2-R1_Chr1-3g01858 [Microbotryum saponariae]